MPDQLLLTLEESMSTIRVGRTKLFQLIKDGEIESVTIGRSRRVPAEALTSYVERLRAQQAGTVASDAA